MSLLKQGQWTIALLGLVFLFSLAALAASRWLVKRSTATPGKPVQAQSSNQRRLAYRHKVNGIKIVDVRNFKSDNWVEELEIDVKNISDKPIYYILLWVRVDEVKWPPRNFPVAFQLEYGSRPLLNVGDLAGPDDISLKPGESYTFKIPEKQIKNWNEKKKEMGDSFPAITEIELYVQMVNFGDGTGYFGGQYESRKKTSSLQEAPSSNLIANQVLPVFAKFQLDGVINPKDAFSDTRIGYIGSFSKKKRL